MEKRFQDFEDSIKKRHSIRFTPKYVETFSVKLKPRTFIEIAAKTFEELRWDVTYQDEEHIEAIHKAGGFSQNISAKLNHLGDAEVKSESLSNEMWDMGRNSKRVKLFIFAFQEVLKEFDVTKIAELEKEIQKKDNWDDYQIPDILPTPITYKKPQILFPLIGILLVSILTSYLIASLSIEGLYIIGLYELGVGLLLGFSFKFLIKLGNYSDWNKIRLMLIGAIALIFILNQMFQYQLILSRNGYEPIGFLSFLKLRLENGLTIKEVNVGAIGLIVSWVFQLGVTYLIGYLRTISALINFTIERVPKEVIDFAMYHLIKGKSEETVRQELSKLGWKNDLEQEMVIEAISGIQGGHQMSKKDN
jgi:hypothetical protein